MSQTNNLNMLISGKLTGQKNSSQQENKCDLHPEVADVSSAAPQEVHHQSSGQKYSPQSGDLHQSIMWREFSTE